MCQFNHVAGDVKLRSTNFERVSKLDARCPWVKVRLMLYGYQLDEKAGKPPASKQESKKSASSPALLDVAFAERSSTYAKDLSTNSLQQLQSEVQMQKAFESQIKKTLRHYDQPGVQVDSIDLDRAKTLLLDARGLYLARTGKEVLRAVQPLVDLV